MKNVILLLFAAITVTSYAQPPARFSYQGVVRNATGAPVTNRAVTLRLSILNGSASGPAVYTETQSVTTNAFGLYTLAVGGGKTVSGKMAAVNWAIGDKYIKVEMDIDGGSRFSDIGTAQLLSVPFALYAASGPGGNTSNGLDPYWRLDGNAGTVPGTDFLGTTDNKRLDIRTNNKLSGFLDPANSNVALGTEALKNNAGNNMVAIGDSALYTQGTNPYGNYGNTAVGSKSLYSNTYGTDNTALGFRSLYSNTYGNFNTAAGFRALYANTGGEANTAIGNESLTANTTGGHNTSVGFFSLTSNTNGYYNTATGVNSMRSNTTGSFNTASGWSALYSNISGTDNTAAGWSALYSNTTGYSNVASGFSSLYSNSSGHSNTASGWSSMKNNTTGYTNTATGNASLYYNTSGYANVANGYYSMYSNTTGRNNTASGIYSLYSNTSGYNNTASGISALNSNTTGYNNTAAGSSALYYNTYGDNNTASGLNAMYSNTSGYYNTASGVNALYSNSSGAANAALGYNAMYSNTSGLLNTGVGYYSLYSNTTGNYNTALGYYANVGSGNLSNATALGYNAIAYSSNSVIVGNTGVTSIGGQVSWTSFSDGRYKTNVQEDVHGLDFILQLKPVTYNFDRNKLAERTARINGSNTQKLQADTPPVAAEARYSGFIAQDVEKAAKSVGYDFSGVDKPSNDNATYGLRYAEFVVPLIKAVQEQQQVIEKLKKEINELKQVQKAITSR
jgi:hypothetical protein